VGLEPERVLREGQEFDLAVRLVEHDRGGGLVDLARLDADEAVLDVVDPPDPVPAATTVQLLDERDAVHVVPVEADRPAAVEPDRDLLGSSGAALGSRVHW